MTDTAYHLADAQHRHTFGWYVLDPSKPAATFVPIEHPREATHESVAAYQVRDGLFTVLETKPLLDVLEDR